MRNAETRLALTHKLLAALIVLAAAGLLKAFYSRASSEDLVWIIGPVAYLVELFSSLKFIHENGYGWIDFDQNVVIAPACAGVNFMIISFCMSAFQLTHRTHSFVRLLAQITLATIFSYAITIFANVLRILLSTFLYNVEFHSSWATPAAVHRIVGTCVFYLLLFSYSRGITACLRHQALERQPDKKQNPLTRQLMFLMPLFWYLAFSVAVPLANQSFLINPERFIEHALSVGVATSLLTLVLFIFCNYIEVIQLKRVFSPGFMRQREDIEARK